MERAGTDHLPAPHRMIDKHFVSGLELMGCGWCDDLLQTLYRFRTSWNSHASDRENAKSQARWRSDGHGAVSISDGFGPRIASSLNLRRVSEIWRQAAKAGIDRSGSK